MILIDSDAESKLVQTLKQLLHDAGETGSVSFRFSHEKISPEKLFSTLPGIVQKELESADSKIFFCEGGDVFVLSPGLHARIAHKLTAAVAKIFDLTMLEYEARFYDLIRDTGRLLALLEPRIEKKKKAEQEARASQLAEAQARLTLAKREAILDVEISDRTKAKISERRAEHKAPEVMLVEDDTFSRRLVGNILSKKYNLTSLENAESALTTYAQLAPDILFLDINLPNVTGHELLDRILLLDPQAYIIMLSGNSDKENVLQAMQRGAKGFVAKPFTPDKIYQYIERCPTVINRSSHAYN
ncbi:response regulator [bacterium]|nr:response regulator [bacterium]